MIEGASIRIVVPDLELYARKYVRSLDEGASLMPYEERLGGITTPAVGTNYVVREHGHLFIYDFVTMRMVPEQAGFRNIVKCSFRRRAYSRLLKDSSHREVDSLYIEAQK